jgi:hypothetical protein
MKLRVFWQPKSVFFSASVLPLLDHRAEFPQFLDQRQSVGLPKVYYPVQKGIWLLRIIYILTYPGFARLIKRGLDWWLNLLDLYTTGYNEWLSDTLSTSDWTLHGNYSYFQLNCQFSQSQSQSLFTTDSQSVCLSWCRAPSGAHDEIFNSVESYSSVHMGCPLWREVGSVICQS